jgi:multidrug efflux pump
VKRKNMDRVITIYSNVLEGYNANEIVAELRDAMASYNLPRGYHYEFTGEQQQQAEDMGFLVTAFGIAVFSIFIILVTQFNSLTSPIIIILSVLFSTIGVFLGYAFTGMDIVVIFTGVGLVSLAGVVVNNAIVLVDYVNLVIKRKRMERNVESDFDLTMDEMKEAIIKGGATRLRPVLLTAITTVLGLIPLAIGFNFNFFSFVRELDPQFFLGGDNTVMWGPMAWTVIFGLVFATFLTLVVVPTMYWLAYRVKLWARTLIRGKKSVTISPSS